MKTISIKSMRIARNMTQKELAEKLKVDQSAVAQWENGKSGPKRSRLVEVAAALDCSLEELVREGK